MRTFNRDKIGLVLVTIATMRFFYSFGLSSVFNALEPYIALDFHLSATMMGFTSSLFFYAEAALVIPAGLMLDRLSPRKITSIALLLSVGGVVMMAYAHDMTALIIARLFMGVGAGLQFSGCVRIVVNWLDTQFIARGMSIVVALGIFGGVIAQAPFAYAIERLGWREAVLCVATVGLLIIIIAYIFVPDHPKDYKLSDAAANINALSIFKRFKLVFLKKQNILCGLYVSLLNLPLFMLGAVWGASYLVAVNGVSELEASSICAMIFIGAIVGTPLFGMLSDRMGSRTQPIRYGAFLSLLLVLGMIFFKTNNFWLLNFLYFLLGFITSSQIIAFPTVIESNSKGISSSATSIISIISILGGGISQPIFGWIVSGFGYRAAFWMLPTAFALSLLASFFIRETHCKRLEE